MFRVFIRHWRLENSLATTQNSPAKFCLFPERAMPFHYKTPVTLQYSHATLILNENHECFIIIIIIQSVEGMEKTIIIYCMLSM